jgi:hypothetical protein
MKGHLEVAQYQKTNLCASKAHVASAGRPFGKQEGKDDCYCGGTIEEDAIGG